MSALAQQIISAVASGSFGSAREIVDYFGGSPGAKRRTLRLVADLKQQGAIRINNRHWLLPSDDAEPEASRAPQPTEAPASESQRVRRLEIILDFDEAAARTDGLARFGLRDSSSIDFIHTDEGVEEQVQRELSDPTLASRLQAVFGELSREARTRELAGIRRRRAYRDMTENRVVFAERRIADRRLGKKKLGPAQGEIEALIRSASYPSVRAIAKALRNTACGIRNVIRIASRMEQLGIIEWQDGSFVSRWDPEVGIPLSVMMDPGRARRQADAIAERHAMRATGESMPLTSDG